MFAKNYGGIICRGIFMAGKNMAGIIWRFFEKSAIFEIFEKNVIFDNDFEVPYDARPPPDKDPVAYLDAPVA